MLIGVLRNCCLLDLRTALNNLHDDGVAQVALYIVVFTTAVRTMNLYCVVSSPASCSRGEVFCDPGLHDGIRVSCVFKVSSLIAEQACSLHIGKHVRNHLL